MTFRNDTHTFWKAQYSTMQNKPRMQRMNPPIHPLFTAASVASKEGSSHQTTEDSGSDRPAAPFPGIYCIATTIRQHNSCTSIRSVCGTRRCHEWEDQPSVGEMGRCLDHSAISNRQMGHVRCDLSHGVMQASLQVQIGCSNMSCTHLR